jgi:hypothetical protein
MQQYQDSRADKQTEYEMQMTKMGYDYDVQMERAKGTAMAAEYALQEVKSVISTVSNATKKASSISAKVSSWFK